MDDEKIKELFEKRDQNAINETAKKYGSYCYVTANRILQNGSDAEECVNDAYLAVWNRIPPENPDDLGAFVSKITRNIAVDRLRHDSAGKRGGSEADQIITELDECCGSAEDAAINKELITYLRRFIRRLPKRDRDIFVNRYYFGYSTEDIASYSGYGEDYIRTILQRSRQKLKAMFEKEGLL